MIEQDASLAPKVPHYGYVLQTGGVALKEPAATPGAQSVENKAAHRNVG